jgi:hypothetical protein
MDLPDQDHVRDFNRFKDRVGKWCSGLQCLLSCWVFSLDWCSILQGNILAYTSIAVLKGASDKGTLCALNGAVTLIDDAITAVTNCVT